MCVRVCVCVYINCRAIKKFPNQSVLNQSEVDVTKFEICIILESCEENILTMRYLKYFYSKVIVHPSIFVKTLIIIIYRVFS